MTFDEFVKKYNFNSHAHVERDENDLKFVDTKINFNSHAHVERDALKTDLSQHLWHFNSHAHVERDFDVLSGLGPYEISTHTLTWSVT